MKKGCLIAVAVVVFLAVVVSIGAFVAYKKMGGSVMDIASAGVLYGVEAGAAAYQAQNPEAQVETTNEAWAAVLKDFEVEGESLSRIVIERWNLRHGG